MAGLLLLAVSVSTKQTRDPDLQRSDIEQAVSDMLEDVRTARNLKDYVSRLTEYETFKGLHKDSGVCFPTAGEFIEGSTPMNASGLKKRCKQGYKLGQRHGKLWAEITVRDGKSKSEGIESIRCLLAAITPRSLDLLPLCAFKAAQQNFDRWYDLFTTPAKMKEYRKLRLEESYLRSPAGSKIVSNDAQRKMTPGEMEYVKAIGTTDYTEAKLAASKRGFLN